MAEQILEFAESGPLSKDRIDRQAGLIRGVKLLGAESRNPPPHHNSYPLSTREKAKSLFENAPVFIDHPPRDKGNQTRSVREKMGFVRNVRESGDGLIGDWAFSPSHTLANDTFWMAENEPAGVSFSINATAGKIRFENGRKIIENFEALHSLDLVTRGATTRSLFESELPMSKIKNRKIFEALADRAVREGKSKVAVPDMLKLLEDDYAPMMGNETEVADTGGDAFEHLCSAIGAAMKNGDWDMADTLYKAAKKASGKDAAPEKKEGDEEKAEESLKTKTTADAIKRLQETYDLKIKSRDLCAADGLVPGKVLLKALDSCTTEAEVKELIQESLTAVEQRGSNLGVTVKHQKPKSGPPQRAGSRVQEGQINIPEDVLKDGRKLAEFCRN